MDIPNDRYIDLMDAMVKMIINKKPLAYIYRNLQTFKEGERAKDTTECHHIFKLLREFNGSEKTIFGISSNNDLYNTQDTEDFMDSVGFKSYFEEKALFNLQLKEREKNEDKKLNLDIQLSEKQIWYYDNKIKITIITVVVGALIGGFIKHILDNILQPKEKSQQELLLKAFEERSAIFLENL